MVLVPLARGFLFPCIPSTPANHGASSGLGTAMDAAGEIFAQIGRVRFAPGVTGPKTISSAGGKIRLGLATTTVFANASTNVQVGIQDLAGTANPNTPDGTFDVSGNLTTALPPVFDVPGRMNEIPMTSGSKSLAHDQEIAIVCNMTVRGGADSVVPAFAGAPTGTNNLGYPYVINNTTGVFAESIITTPGSIIVFDDGSLGVLNTEQLMSELHSSIGVNSIDMTSGSDPNEAGMSWIQPFDCEIDAIQGQIRLEDANADCVLNLWRDPLDGGSSMWNRTLTYEESQQSATFNNEHFSFMLNSRIPLARGTRYGVTARATGSGLVRFTRLGVFNNAQLGMWPGGTSLRTLRRTGGTGAFSVLDTSLNRMIAPLGVRVKAVYSP